MIGWSDPPCPSPNRADQTVRRDGNAGLTAHDFHESKDPPVGHDLLHLSRERAAHRALGGSVRYLELLRGHWVVLGDIQRRHLTNVRFPLGMSCVIRALHTNLE